MPQDLTLYNQFFGLTVTLPANTRFYDLQNLGLGETDFADNESNLRTNYGEGATVFSLVDMALDRGGEPNFCRVILAVEQVNGAASILDFAVLLSRRLTLSSEDKDYEISFDGMSEVSIGDYDYYRLDFTEYQQDEDNYKYEVYVRSLGEYYFTAVLFYSDKEGSPGASVGQSYLESGIRFNAAQNQNS